MLDPSWLADVVAGIVLVIALYRVARIVTSLISGRRVELDADVIHVLMGIGMAGMFVSSLAILDAAVWAVVFGLASAWYAVRVALARRLGGGHRGGLRLHSGHLVSALAMLYMFLALPTTSASSMRGMSMGSGSSTAGGGGMGAHLPTLALLFALSLFCYAVLVADTIPLRSAAALATGTNTGAGTSASEPEPHERPGRLGRIGRIGWRCAPRLGSGPLLAPRSSATCEVVMSVSMGVMLIAML